MNNFGTILIQWHEILLGIQSSACHLFICLQKVECTDSSIETYNVFFCLLSILYQFVSRFTMTIQDNFNIDRQFCKYDPDFWTILLQWHGILSGIQISACQPFNCLGSSFPLPLIYSPVPIGGKKWIFWLRKVHIFTIKAVWLGLIGWDKQIFSAIKCIGLVDKCEYILQ